MNLTNQLLKYSEQERLALVSCISSITTDKAKSEDEINFVLALIEAADLDAIKMKSNSSLMDKANHLMNELKTEPARLNQKINSLEHSTKKTEGSFLEKMVLSLYLK